LGSDASHLVAAHDCLVDVRARHGEHGLLVFVDLLIDTWAELAKLDRAASGPATSPQERLAEWQRREQQQLARRELKIAHVCEGCGKVRLGRRWVKGKPRPGYVAMSDLCPECDAKTIASP
jgi:hypothetical protein